MTSLFKRHFEIVEGEYGRRLILKSPWSARLCDVIIRENVKELELNYAHGWQGTDIMFLKYLPFLLAFNITDWKIRDISPIHLLCNLRSLDVYTDCRSPIDFSCFPSLESVGLEWRRKATSIYTHQTLRRLFVSEYSEKDLSSFAQLIRLEALTLKSTRIEKIGDLSPLQRLELLSIASARRLASLAGVENLPSLRRLEVNSCRKIFSIEPIRHLTRLEHLELCDDGEIVSLEPISQLKQLAEFYFYESTNIVDGNLDPIRSLPRLKRTSFQNRRHYNARREEFEEQASKE